jgi:signal transduction histidine kinase
VKLEGNEHEAAVVVHNWGASIAPERLDGLFNPLRPGTPTEHVSAPGPTGSLGLGLYIGQQIITAHAGRIDSRIRRQGWHHV